MKKIFALILLIAFATSCTKRTEFGECIGINGEKDPTLHYEYSGWNIFMGIFFIETIFVPINVSLYNLICPVSKK